MGICIAIIVIAVIVNVNKTKQLKNEGKIIQRQSAFWENAEIFTTCATYEQVKSAVKSSSYSESSVTIEYDLGGQNRILFKSKHSWNASLECLEQQNNKTVFKLYFPAWKTSKYGAPYNVNSMNALLTSIEKIFLSIDPTTTVETRKLEIKTKTKIF